MNVEGNEPQFELIVGDTTQPLQPNDQEEDVSDGREEE